jgi:ketosteroid isomerase-like protein
MDTVEAAVAEANAGFYHAFEAGDIDGIAERWSHDDDVICAHPGRVPLRGWSDVQTSWQAIVQAGNQPQMILTDVTVTVRGAIAWVTVTENMLANRATATASAINVFQLIDDRWLMVAHHAGPIIG